MMMAGHVVPAGITGAVYFSLAAIAFLFVSMMLVGLHP